MNTDRIQKLLDEPFFDMFSNQVFKRQTSSIDKERLQKVLNLMQSETERLMNERQQPKKEDVSQNEVKNPRRRLVWRKN